MLVPATATAPRDTKGRLLAAAAELFAAHGFHGTTIRDIAERAGVNVAAGHYHVGSKKDLYLEVLREEFAKIRAVIAERGATLPPAHVLDGLGRRGLEALLRARMRSMLDVLLGPPPGLHGTLMQREMCDPSEALPVIVEEFILPMVREVDEIVGRLAPRLDAAGVRRVVFSAMGQSLFYRFCMPAVLRMMGRDAYPKGFTASLAEHVAEFSLGGLDRVAAARPGRTRRAR
jgi:AcrR family transcriptional regulator